MLLAAYANIYYNKWHIIKIIAYLWKDERKARRILGVQRNKERQIRQEFRLMCFKEFVIYLER